MKGYCHPGYAASLVEFGIPRELPRCGGWVLERPIPGSQCRDAMGCYPLFSCQDWSKLHSDLHALKDDLVCLSVVTDPFGHYDLDLLRNCFNVVIPFKEHFVRDLRKPLNLSRHHRRYTRKSFENVCIDVCSEPIRFINEWIDLYSALVKRFNIKGIRAFSELAFRKQLTLPGAIMFRALYQGTAVSSHLVYAQDDVCYAHLAGCNSIGQELMASYAIYWTEIEYFSDNAQWLDWGGTVGIRNDNNDGLTQFKRGWSTETPTSYFCGRIFNRDKYDEIQKLSGITATDYFPAYRKGEFS
jgi:hypothetical protein